MSKLILTDEQRAAILNALDFHYVNGSDIFLLCADPREVAQDLPVDLGPDLTVWTDMELETKINHAIAEVVLDWRKDLRSWS
jgi:hypothetical protein